MLKLGMVVTGSGIDYPLVPNRFIVTTLIGLVVDGLPMPDITN
jgi:hypothetical protein